MVDVKLSSAPLRKWRVDAEKFEDEKREAQAELKAEEQRRSGELQAGTPEAWDQWLHAALSRHLASHPALDARFEGVGQAVGELVAELRRRLDANEAVINKQRDEIVELKLECARLAIKICEVQTDKVLAAMPGLGTPRSAVN
jgi:hypothetical protein